MSHTLENNNLFAEFLDDYFAECEEHLAVVRQELLALEPSIGQQADVSILNQLFRRFHSLKGLSGMVGVKEAEELAHQMESYLRALREEQVVLSSEGFDALMTGTRLLEKVIAAYRNQSEIPHIEEAIAQLASVIPESTAPNPPGAIAPVELKLPEAAQQQLLKAQQKGLLAWHFVFTPDNKLTERGINVNQTRERLQEVGQLIHAAPRLQPDGGIVFDLVLTTSQSPETIFADGPNQGLSWTPYSLAEPVREPSITETVAINPKPSSELEVPIIPSTPLAQPSNLVRVELPKLDRLMQMVGELVISRARLEENLRYLSDKLLASDLRAMQEINLVLERQLRELREGVMQVRLVPIGEVFARMQFVVRDLVRASKKQVNLEVKGQETEIDKFVVERTIDPLLHLVRNAVSHGIESEAERLQSGKPAAGTIVLRASTVGETVAIEIEDDGRGVDGKKVIEQALNKGLLQEQDKADAHDSLSILELLCSPGFSTKEEADLTSGRGVGMAIVKNTVQELGGLLSLKTQPGRGTCFTIQLPLTLAIADALIVKVGDQIFAIPQSSVVEVIDVSPDKITVLENNEIIFYRGNVLPILRLQRLFRYNLQGLSELKKNNETPDRHQNQTNTKTRKSLSVAIVGNNLNGLNACGIVVDKFIGLREIVVRPLTDPLVRVVGITGATELGDGRVVLILDIGALIRRAVTTKIKHLTINN